jgi:HEAT repeat protein
LSALVATSRAEDTKAPASSQEAKLIAIVKSSASEKEKADACMVLARVGTKESVAPLAALLGDEKLGHMARYALEPIPDPAVDDALRDSLDKLKGRPLVGVIGSIGVRRDAKAADRLCKLVKDPDLIVAQAAARALGNLGTSLAAKDLEKALDEASIDRQSALCEGLFRCAETLSAHGKRDEALAIYERLSRPELPRPVRDGAARKARILRQEEGQKI